MWEKKKKDDQYRQSIIEQETPFRPKLSKNTEQIAKVARERCPGLLDELSRNTSCKCFGKNNNKGSTAANTARKPEGYNRSKSPISMHSQKASNDGKMKKSKTQLTIDPYC